MEQVQFEAFISIVQNLGMSGLFAWLYVMERREHNETRKLWAEDLRDIAGLKKSLHNEQTIQNRTTSDNRR